MTAMQKIHLLVPFLILAAYRVAANQTSVPEASEPPAQPTLKLKSVELDQKYTIKIPDDFTVHRVSDRVSSIPMYVFDAPQSHYTAIQVFVLPYAFVIAVDENTGLFRLPIEINGSPPLTGFFKIHGDRYAYYGWSVYDQTQECTMN